MVVVEKRDTHCFQEVHLGAERLPLELQRPVVEALQLLSESEQAEAGNTSEGAEATRLPTSDTRLRQ